MDFVENFGAQINTCSYIREHKNIFCIRVNRMAIIRN